MIRMILVAVILLCTINGVSAEEVSNGEKVDSAERRSDIECINTYPHDMLDIVRTGDGFLTSYRPMYLGYSLYAHEKRNDGDIKFQISFKYNIAGDFFLGYTQKSFWNVKESSAGIKENDYAPELFYIHNNDNCDFGENTWLPYQYMLFGLRHESNGMKGPDSHGWNMVFIEPYFALSRYKNLIVSPSLWFPFTNSRNKVLVDDIGIGKVTVKWQHYKFFQLSADFGCGLKGNKYRVESTLNVFLDQSKHWFSPTIFVQGFKGYGESLARHDKNTSRIVLGLSITR